MRQYEFIKKNKQVGNYFFSKNTMRFFKSKVLAWDCINGYFITREVNSSGNKGYTIRKADFETGRVNTVGEFFAHSSLKGARQALKAISPTTDLRLK